MQTVESSLKYFARRSLAHAIGLPRFAGLLTVYLLTFCGLSLGSGHTADAELERFKIAWSAAGKGDHTRFNQIKDTLQDYLLFPYLQYEDYRKRRSEVSVDEMSDFLETHRDWAFTPGLRSAWLRALAKKRRWADLVAHSEGVSDTVLRCQRVRGQIILKQTDGVLSEAQNLWTAGKSQPDECDPVFAWLVKNGGISDSLAWERIRLAMTKGNRSLAAYLGRYIPGEQRRLLDHWIQLSRGGYARLEKARSWPDTGITRMITQTSLQSLARNDASMAASKFQMLDGNFSWEEAQRLGLLRDIALYSAVGLEDGTNEFMAQIPESFRDSQLLEWWARFLLSRNDWFALTSVIQQMPEEVRSDSRWRYWLAQAELRSGQEKTSSELLGGLAKEANYYGFLAADELGVAYNICPLQPDVKNAEIKRVAGISSFQRALELRKAELENWAIEEWSLATSRLPVEDLKIAAALAQREGWNDRVIFALGNSGNLRFYEWRFPLLWESEIKHEAATYDVDSAWVYGTIRSESAMVVTARSSANAMGLMQVTPATGKRVARKHGLAWSGIAQLRTVSGNLPIGVAYMHDLLGDFSQNPVLVSGAYNAGPNAVKRWLEKRPLDEAAIWVETLPYYETRDYIPRVLAFTTIYDWRLGGPVKRISARMPHLESGKIGADGFAEVMCLD
jgi:soluble lytic murein transglycosylase